VIGDIYRRTGMAAVLIILIITMSVTAPNFLTAANLLDVASQTSVVAILGAGATFVILTGGIDLSAGSALGVGAMVAMVLASAGAPGVVCVLACIAACTAAGLLNGFFIAYWGLPSFIVTLAALTYLRGLVYVGTNGTTVFLPTLDFAWLGQGTVLGVPVPVIIMVLVFAAGWLIINRTVFGRHVLSVGGNSAAASLAGISVRKTLLWVYIIAGICVGIGAVISAARLQSASPTIGTGYELNAIAAVVLGGTSLMGGRGSILGTLVGALIVGVLANGMTLMNVPSFYQLIVQGAVIIAAVGIDKLSTRRRR